MELDLFPPAPGEAPIADLSDMNSTSSSPPTPIVSLFSPCSEFPTPKNLMVSITVIKAALLLPLSLTVLYLAFRKRPPSSRRSHAHFFACQLALLELVGVLALLLYLCGLYAQAKRVETAGVLLAAVTPPGEILILSLTCVDRYLAVARPVTYLQLKGGNGVLARDVSAALVWIVSSAFIGFSHLHALDLPVVEFVCLLVSSVAVVSFCSAAVLRVLIRPAPGDAPGKRRETAGGSKRRAFRIIVTVLCVQMLWLLGFLICVPIHQSSLSRHSQCLLMTALAWFNLPCSLVSPVLFLQTRRCG